MSLADRPPDGFAPRRLFLGVGYAVYLCVVAYLVFAPHATTSGGIVEDLTEWVNDFQVGQITTAPIEFGCNVALFVPLTLLGSLLWPNLRAWHWLLIGLGVSLFIEATQLLLLPDRVGSVRDLVSNTLGAGLGLALAAAVRLDLRATSARRRERVLDPRVRHWVLYPCAALSILGAAFLVLEPSHARTAGYVQTLSDALSALGAPAVATNLDILETLSNIALTFPLGLLAALLVPSWPALRWLAIGLAASLLVEMTQAWVMSHRDGSVADVSANTLGFLLGVVAAQVVMGWVGSGKTVPESVQK